MSNVSGTNAALAAALRRIPGREKGGDCISVFPSSRPSMFDLYRLRLCDPGSELMVAIDSESARTEVVLWYLEHMAGEDSCPIFLRKKLASGVLRHMWQLVATDLTPALIQGRRIEVKFNPT